LPHDLVDRVAPRTMLLEEWLLKRAAEGCKMPFQPLKSRALVHVHCQQKAVLGANATISALKLIPDLEIEFVDAGCCGMAGAFGYEKEHYEVSVAMAERRLLPAVRTRGEATYVVATGTSCRSQVHDLTGVRALHPAQLLARALNAPVHGG
ncbi:MAG: FAD-binding oxidoreductase, partial [Armatimonadetes bacterium]|nr:FAD-binding oxidoreductase [Armatimonadota bacterium]